MRRPWVPLGPQSLEHDLGAVRLHIPADEAVRGLTAAALARELKALVQQERTEGRVLLHANVLAVEPREQACRKDLRGIAFEQHAGERPQEGWRAHR